MLDLKARGSSTINLKNASKIYFACSWRVESGDPRRFILAWTNNPFGVFLAMGIEYVC